MKQVSVKCNMCGSEIDEMDLECNDFSIEHRFGYGSKHDGDHLYLDLCSSCQDKLVTYLLSNCIINPIEEIS